MMILKGHRPSREKMFEQTRGYNGAYCYYDDLSLWEQCYYDCLCTSKITIAVFAKRGIAKLFRMAVKKFSEL